MKSITKQYQTFIYKISTKKMFNTAALQLHWTEKQVDRFSPKGAMSIR